jgi:hypothetical protein
MANVSIAENREPFIALMMTGLSNETRARTSNGMFLHGAS